MDRSGGFRDGKEGGETRGLGLSKKGKTAAKSDTNKPQQSKRGPGIAQLEAMRVQDEMKSAYLRTHLPQQQPSAISGPGIHGLGTVVVFNGLPCYQPAYGRGSMPYPVHPNSAVAYGTRAGGVPSGYYKLLPVVSRPLCTSEAASYENPSNMAPKTLSLFKETPDHHKEGKSAYLKREESHNNLSAGESTSKDSSDPHDLDLDLKL